MNYKICESCNSTYSTGKDYGNYLCVTPMLHWNIEKKGLCEFCNIKILPGALKAGIVCLKVDCRDDCIKWNAITNNICRISTKKEKESMYTGIVHTYDYEKVFNKFPFIYEQKRQSK